MPAPDGVLQGQFDVRLYSVAGVQVADITNFTKLSYAKSVNDVGSFQLTIAEPSGTGLTLDSLPALMVEDALVVILRRIPGILDWYSDFTGFVRGTLYDTDAVGNLSVTAKGVGTLDLLSRRVTAYAAGTRQTEKYGPSDSAIYQFVDENVGANATTANGRYASGVTPSFTVAAPAGFGATWQGARHMQNVLAVAQGISVQMADVEFSMATTVGGGSVAHALSIVPRIGTNKASTVRFSKPMGNVGAPKSSNDATSAKNRVFVLGPGEKADRIVLTVNNAARQAVSPWALTEKTREATQEQTGLSLANLGATELELSRPVVSYAFTPIETPSTRYGVHYSLGDTVTAITDDGTVLTLRVIGVSINNDGGDSGAETIALTVTVLR